MSKNFTHRLLAAVVLMPLAIGATYVGGWVFAGMLMVLLALMLREWVRLTCHKSYRVLLALGSLWMILVVALGIWLRLDVDQGLWLAFFVVGCVWTTDSMAYVTGKLIGGPRLIPAVSPNKTWAGTLGGLVSAVIFAVIYHSALTEPLFTPKLVILLAVAVSMSDLLGDLLVSRVKRARQVKDTGSLIPGHGGVIDRMDGFLLSIPVFSLIIYLLGV